MSSTCPIAVVTGANGLQGSSIVRRLTKAGYEVRGLVRDRSHSQHIQSMGAVPTVVNFADSDSLAQALNQAELVVFNAPINHRPGAREQLTAQIIKAAEQAQVGRIVFNSAAEIFEDYARPVSQVLKEIRHRLHASDVSVITLQPTVYMDNLAAPWAAPAIVQEGIFAYPIQSSWPISWISHLTLADFVLAAARHRATDDEIFLIGGPEALTAEMITTILSQTLGKPVCHVPVSLADFSAGLNAAYGTPAGDDIADLYRYLETHPKALLRDGSAAVKLGVTPEPFSVWASRQDWSNLAIPKPG